MEENLARLRTHHNNIRRYRRLLKTQPSELAQAYLTGRLAEEEASAEALLQTTFPIRFQIPKHPDRAIA